MSTEHLRLLARVARMYHEQSMRQPEIAAALSISQPRVSRLLKEAVTRGIVRTVVVLPDGVHTDLEEELEAEQPTVLEIEASTTKIVGLD